jgi:hypothetical protein
MPNKYLFVKLIEAKQVSTGIWPLNTNIFTEEDFLPSQVTDRPLDNNLQQNTSAVIEDENNDVLSNSTQRFPETNNPRWATSIDIDNGPTCFDVSLRTRETYRFQFQGISRINCVYFSRNRHR